MKKTIIFLGLFLFVFTGLTLAQSLKPKKILKPIHFDISRPLSEVEPIPPGYRERSWKQNTINNFFNFADEFAREEGFDKSKISFQNSAQLNEEAQIVKNFPGVPNLSGVAPPDTDGDVGPNHYFQMINLAFSIWDKDGNQLMAPADNQTLWEGFDDGQPFDNANDGDPIILYDEYADRWIASQFAVHNWNGKYYELIAVSTTPDPLGTWYRYAYEFDNMPDYPKFGVWPDGYYFSINQFDNYNWAGGGICAVNRNKMINGDADAEIVFFDLGTAYGSLLPADADGSMQPPTGSPEYFVSVGSNNLKLWEVDIDWANTANSTANYLTPLSTEFFYSNGINIKQKGTSQNLDALNGRLMFRLQYRNFGEYETMMANHSVRVDDNGRAGVKWYELRRYPGNDWQIHQEGTYAPDDGNSRWMGSIAMNDNGDIALAYSASGSNLYPAIRFTGRLAGTDTPLGEMNINEQTIKQSNQPQTNLSRWGDYSCMSVDPVDGTTFWFTSEWTNGSWSWRTQIASLDFTQVPEADFTADETIIPAGEAVNFTDLTSGNPDNWQWTFEGAETATSTEENPQNIVYQNDGTFNVSLTVSNTAGQTTETKNSFISVSSTILPEVDFMADKLGVCLGDTVSFTDLSKYLPRSWEWNFEPSNVTFVNGTSAQSQNPQVVFNEVAAYNVTLTATNLNGNSSLTKENEIMAGGYLPYFEETFENEGFRSQNWTVDNPDNEITWDIYSVSGNEPGNRAAAIKLNDYFPLGGRDRLISPPINLEGMDNAVLEFQHAYALKSSKQKDSLIVLVSPDCGNTWQRVYADADNGSGNFATADMNSDFWPVSSLDWCGIGYGASCLNVDLNPWLGQNQIKIAFESYNDYGNPLFIDNVIISQYLATDELKNEKFDIYPNPSNGNITIKSSGDYLKEIKIYSLDGHLLYQQKINSLIVDIKSNITSSGMYMLRLETDKGMFVRKIIVR